MLLPIASSFPDINRAGVNVVNNDLEVPRHWYGRVPPKTEQNKKTKKIRRCRGGATPAEHIEKQIAKQLVAKYPVRQAQDVTKITQTVAEPPLRSTV